MKQGIGKIHLSGSDNTYDSKIQVLSDNSKFKITSAIYSVYLYNMSSGDKAEGRFNIGNYQSPRITFRKGLTSFEHTITNEINNFYKNSGINAIKPLSFDTNWFSGKSVQFVLLAETKTAPTVQITGVDGDSVFGNIVVKWNSTMQEKFTITATKGNTTKTYSGTIETTYSINATDFIISEGMSDGNVKISLKIEFTNNNTLSENAWASEETSVNLKDTSPKLTELKAVNNVITFKGKNLDGISASVQINNKDLNNALVGKFNLSKNEVDNQKFEIPSSTILYDGEHVILFEVKKIIAGTVFSPKMTTTMLVTNKPYIKINSLEPSGVLRNYEKAIPISWYSVNQQTFNLSVYQNGVKKFEKSGTTETDAELPPNTLGDGTAEIRLTITNIVYGIVKQDSKSVTFSLYGGLKAPEFTMTGPFDKNYMDITWTKSNLQKYYRIELDIVRLYSNNDNIYEWAVIREDSGIIRGDNNSHRVKQLLLTRDEVYNLKLTIYNEAKEKTSAGIDSYIPIRYRVDGETKLKLYVKDYKIVVNSISTVKNAVSHTVFRCTNRDFANAKAIYTTNLNTFEYQDDKVKSDTEYCYFVISTNSEDRSIKSDPLNIKLHAQGFLFTNLKTKKTYNLNLDVSADFETMDGKVAVEYLGKTTADIEQDIKYYQKGSFSCLIRTDDLQEIDTLFMAEKVSYRDSNGNGFICALLNKKISYNDKYDKYVRLSFDMIENDSSKAFE